MQSKLYLGAINFHFVRSLGCAWSKAYKSGPLAGILSLWLEFKWLATAMLSWFVKSRAKGGLRPL